MWYSENFKDYEFLGIRKIEGEFTTNEGFVEFNPSEDSIKQMVKSFASP